MNHTLLDTKTDTKATISHYKNDDISTAFSCIGFLPGSDVTVINKLPFNGAITCECNDTRFAIRAEDAAQIVVLPE